MSRNPLTRNRMARTTAVLLVPLLLGPVVTPTHAQNELNVALEEMVDHITTSVPVDVVGVDGQTIYLNAGEEDSVREGHEYDVVRAGEAFTVGQRTLHKERPVGEILITRVRKGVSQGRIVAAYAQIQKGDKAYPKQKKPGPLALVEFPYLDSFNEFTRNIYEGLATRLVQKGLQVVEREQLERVFQEQKLSHSGIVDLTTAQKLGRLVGAETMLMGSIAELGDALIIRARLVDVGRAIIITAAEVQVVKTPEVISLLGIRSRPQQQTGPSVEPTSKPGVEKRDLYFENEFIRIEVLAFSRQANDLVLRLRYVNKTQSPFNMQLQNKKRNTFLVDEAGNSYPFNSTDMGFWYQDITILPEVPRTATITFADERGVGRKFTFSAEYGWHQGKGSWVALARSTFFVTIKNLKLP